jgi:hypothetical protein
VAIADEQGAFTFLGVQAGRYVARLCVQDIDATQAPAGLPAALAHPRRVIAFAQSAEIIVGQRDVRGVSLDAKPTPRLKGRIQFVGSPPPADEIALMGLSLATFPGNANPAPSTALISADGTFEMTGYPQGRYSLRAYLGEWGLVGVRVGSRDLDDMYLDVGTTDLTDLVFTASHYQNAPLVTGTVELPPGLTGDEVTGAIFPTDYAERLPTGLSWYRARQVRIGKGPDFGFAFLRPGEYFVVAFREVENEAVTRPFLDRLASRATRVTLGPGDHKEVNLRVTNIR